MPADRRRPESLEHAPVTCDAIESGRLQLVVETLIDVLELAFGYDSKEQRADIFVAVCTLYARHLAELNPEADAEADMQIKAMTAYFRKTYAEEEEAHGPH